MAKRNQDVQAVEVSPIAGTQERVSYFGKAKIRSILIEGEPWFVLTDVSETLGFFDNSNAIRSLDADEKRKVKLETGGGPQSIIVIDESGLYSLTFASHKPDAKRFRKWVTREVLPSLRRTAAGDPQEPGKSDAYVRLPGVGRFTVTLEKTGRLTIDEVGPERYVPEFYSSEVDSMALSTCLVGAIWRKYQLLDALSTFNRERSNTRHQLAAAIRQAQHIAQSAMRTKREVIDSPSS